MKKTKAFSLEEDVIKVIENYKNKYKLSSASSALERIILIELPKRTNLEEIKSLIVELKNNSNINYNGEMAVEIEEEKTHIKNSSLENSFKNSISSMPD